ncbi:MAG: M20/M25/M40 family metallo-hydrolase [Nitrospiraceae bacterium]
MTDTLLERLQAHLQALVGERHPVSSPEALKQAEHYLTEQFRLLGLKVSLHPFDALGGTYYNVVAALSASASAGSPAPNEGAPLLIAAHYDTVPGSPGADDNASGLAILLEVARSLRDISLSREVRFIGFCLEEEDLLGSLAYAAHLRAGNQALRGAIVLECVGYTRVEEGSQLVPPGLPITVPSVGNFLGIVGNTASAELATIIERSANRAMPDLKTVSLLIPGQGELFPDTRRSDHAAFWAYGYPAVMLTDTANFRNPHYHEPTDSLDTLDLTFMEQVAPAVTAVAIRLAGRE